jgi:hypothetical protein
VTSSAVQFNTLLHLRTPYLSPPWESRVLRDTINGIMVLMRTTLFNWDCDSPAHLVSCKYCSKMMLLYLNTVWCLHACNISSIPCFHYYAKYFLMTMLCMGVRGKEIQDSHFKTFFSWKSLHRWINICVPPNEFHRVVTDCFFKVPTFRARFRNWCHLTGHNVGLSTIRPTFT